MRPLRSVVFFREGASPAKADYNHLALNSIVTDLNGDLTLGAVSDVVAHDLISRVSASFALVAERPAMRDLAWIMRARPNDVDTALTKCFVSATNSEAALSPPKDQK